MRSIEKDLEAKSPEPSRFGRELRMIVGESLDPSLRERDVVENIQ